MGYSAFMYSEFLLPSFTLDFKILIQNSLAILLLNAEGRLLIFFWEIMTFFKVPAEQTFFLRNTFLDPYH